MSDKQQESDNVPCVQKVALLEAYNAVTKQYADALMNLNLKIGVSSRTDYAAMYRIVESLRIDAADLRRELEFHVRNHRC
jgi:hypothetical protein